MENFWFFRAVVKPSMALAFHVPLMFWGMVVRTPVSEL